MSRVIEARIREPFEKIRNEFPRPGWASYRPASS